MTWNHLLPAGVLVIVGVALISNADSLARSIRDAEKRYLPFARPDRSVDRPGLLGPDTRGQRTWAVRGVGVVALTMALLVVLNGVFGLSF